LTSEPKTREPNSGAANPGRTPAVVKASMIALFVLAVIFSSWTLLKSFHYASLQGYIHEGIELSLSNFQIEIALAGLTGLLASLFLHGRRRSRKTKASPLKMTPMSFGAGKPVHPLMMTQRPARALERDSLATEWARDCPRATCPGLRRIIRLRNLECTSGLGTFRSRTRIVLSEYCRS
jgi:hypothetical protein